MAKAIIVGATGLIGRNLLEIVLDRGGYDQVLILVREELHITHKKLHQLKVDFNDLNKYTDAISGDAFFCCLGTTKKKTPDKNEYRKIDHDYPVQLAQIAKENSIRQYHFVSAGGANIKSPIFYSRLKGETENDLIAVGLEGLHIYRPSLLTGYRKEHRSGEKIAASVFKLLNPLFSGSLKKYRSIEARTVAKAMFRQSLQNEPGVHIYESDKIQDLG
jgi:uncharacterized protein YbjT (DUF2867 family)